MHNVAEGGKGEPPVPPGREERVPHDGCWGRGQGLLTGHQLIVRLT
ncbi:hypothetical protein ACFPRL_14015 [Pseudoclavibacter helvolus]